METIDIGIPCAPNTEKYINIAKNIYNDYLNEEIEVEPNLAASSIAIMANNGDKDLHKEFFNKYTNSQIPQEKIRFL